jgi:hypothetical protein
VGCAAHLGGGSNIGDGAIVDTLSRVSAHNNQVIGPHTYLGASGVMSKLQRRSTENASRTSDNKSCTPCTAPVRACGRLAAVVLLRYPVLIGFKWVLVRTVIEFVYHTAWSFDHISHIGVVVDVIFAIFAGLTYTFIFMAIMDRVLYSLKWEWGIVNIGFAMIMDVGLFTVFLDSTFLYPIYLRLRGAKIASVADTHLYDTPWITDSPELAF